MEIFVGISAFILLSSLAPRDTLLKNRFVSRSMIFMIVALFIIYIPFLDLYFSDMVRYVTAFERMHYMTLSETLNFYTWEPLFLLIQWTLSKFTQNHMVFILLNFALYVFVLYRSVKKLFLPWQRVFVMFLFFCYPFFYDYIFNGIRQGLSMMLIVLAMTYWIEKRHSIKFYLSAVAACLFHLSSLIFVISIFLHFLFKIKLKSLLFVWSIGVILFLTGLNETLLNFGFISQLDYIDTYTNTNIIQSFGGTNKVSYLVFSAFFLILSLYLYKTLDLEKAQKEIYLNIIKCYTSFNAVFLFVGFIAYSNRMAAFSWHLIPILIAYPILYKNKNSTLLLFLLMFIATAIGIINSPLIKYG